MINRGVIYELDGTSITTSYQAGGLLSSAKASRRRFQIQANLKSSGTSITGIKCKVSASADGTNFVDVQSTDDVSGSTQVEQLYNTVTNHVISGSFSIATGYQFLQVSVKATGGAGQATETLKVYAIDADSQVSPGSSGGASTGNWAFSSNNADLTGAGAMGIGEATATSIVLGSSSIPTTIGSLGASVGVTADNAYNVGDATHRLAVVFAENIRTGGTDNLTVGNTSGPNLVVQGGANEFDFKFGATAYYIFVPSFFEPTFDNSSAAGTTSNRWSNVLSYWYDSKQGSQLTAASTITPTAAQHHITGASTISTIAATNVPSSSNVTLVLIADGGVITWTTGGNIAIAGTIAQNKAQRFVYDSAGTTWYPEQ